MYFQRIKVFKKIFSFIMINKKKKMVDLKCSMLQHVAIANSMYLSQIATNIFIFDYNKIPGVTYNIYINTIQFHYH